MKRTRTFIYAMVALLSAAFTLQSCLDDDDDNYISIDPDTAVGIVTLKPSQSNDGSWLIQLTDSSFAQCSNIKKYPYGDKEYRAYIYFKYDSEPNLTCVLPSITITHIDTLLTKPLAAISCLALSKSTSIHSPPFAFLYCVFLVTSST